MGRRAPIRIDLADGTGVSPDGARHLTAPEGAPRLFALENPNQRRTKRMADKLAEHRYAIGEGAIERQFGYPHSPRILAVFEDDKALDLTLEHISKRRDFENEYYPFFFLKTLTSVIGEFRFGWRKIGRDAIFPMFYELGFLESKFPVCIFLRSSLFQIVE